MSWPWPLAVLLPVMMSSSTERRRPPAKRQRQHTDPTATGEPVVLLFHNNAQPNHRADIKELEVVYPQRTARCQAQHQLAVVHVA